MSSFMSNSQIYNVVTENEVAAVLSHYSSEFIFSVLNDAIQRRFNEVPIIAPPNVVAAWEQNFKAIIAQYGPASTEEVMRVREETYQEIVAFICKEFNLNFTVADVDSYSAAYHLYDFFVCNFSNNMINFFANYIYKNRAAIYDSMNLADLKKNKDSSTIYGKKVYKDIKLAVINANIDMVIDNICGMEIDFYTIINTRATSNDLTSYLYSIVSAGFEFFKNHYAGLLNTDVRPDILTGIRFALQNIASAHEQTGGDDTSITSGS